MSEFYDEYTDEEDINDDTIGNPKINKEFEKIKGLIEDKNMDLDKLMQDLAKDIKNVASLNESKTNDTKNTNEPSNIVAAEEHVIQNNSAI